MTRLIDLHHHFTPRFYREALASLGIGASAGKSLPDWTPEASLSFMDQHGIETAYGSVSEPAARPFVAKDPAKAAALCRGVNEFMAEMKAKHPGRFGGFALVPLPDVERAVAEIDYALDVLKLDGIALLSNYDAKFLGDAVFDPVMAALERHAAVAYVHPSVPAPVTAKPQFACLDFMAEFTFNTTRAAANLMMSGTMDKTPHVRFVLAHMGGALPFLRWRLATTFPAAPDMRASYDVPDEVEKGWASVKTPLPELLSRFWLDTALSTDPQVLAMAEASAPEHTVFGSDAFYAPHAVVQEMLRILHAKVPAEAREKIFRTNAERLFEGK